MEGLRGTQIHPAGRQAAGAGRAQHHHQLRRASGTGGRAPRALCRHRRPRAGARRYRLRFRHLRRLRSGGSRHRLAEAQVVGRRRGAGFQTVVGKALDPVILRSRPRTTNRSDNKNQGGSMSEVRGHDKSYEWKATLVLSLAFGLVGLDRFILPSLFFGHIDVDLGLNEGHLGQIVGILAVAWGVSAVVFGGLSDRLGRRNVLVPAVVFFSVMSWASGAVTGLVSLLLVRALMGVAEGAVAPTGVAAVVEASHPHRRGINNGFFQCAIALFGLAIAPIMATQLLQYMSWRWVFLIAGVPGLVVAFFLWKIIREPRQLATAVAESAAAPKPPLASIFRHRNIVVSMLALMCAMMGIFIL